MLSDVITRNSMRCALRAVGARVHCLVGVPLSGCDSRHALRYPRQATFLLRNTRRRGRRLLSGVRLFSDTAADEIVEENGGRRSRWHRSGRAKSSSAALRLPGRRLWHCSGRREDHQSGEADHADERLARLEKWARGKMPMFEEATHRWSRQVLDTVDYAGFIGKIPGSQTVHVATGDFGQVLTHGVMGALLNAMLITGGQSEWAELYAPERMPLEAAKNWVMENSTALENLDGICRAGERSPPLRIRTRPWLHHPRWS
jgi:hypothetical protein